MTTNNPTTHRRGFTLIELLTVIAIIGLLAGILIPVTGTVLNKVREARSKNTFSSYATAFVSYRQDYGIFPPFGSLPFDVQTNSGNDFHIALSGKDASGNIPGSRALNRKLTAYYTFSDGDYGTAGDIADAFDNTAIYVNFEPTPGAGIPSGGYVDDAEPPQSISSGPLMQPVIVWSAGVNSSQPTIRSWD